MQFLLRCVSSHCHCPNSIPPARWPGALSEVCKISGTWQLQTVLSHSLEMQPFWLAHGFSFFLLLIWDPWGDENSGIKVHCLNRIAKGTGTMVSWEYLHPCEDSYSLDIIRKLFLEIWMCWPYFSGWKFLRFCSYQSDALWKLCLKISRNSKAKRA